MRHSRSIAALLLTVIAALGAATVGADNNPGGQLTIVTGADNAQIRSTRFR